MNIHELRNVIKEVIIQEISDGPADYHNYAGGTDINSQLFRTPGSPFGGKYANVSVPLMSNETKDALRQWTQFAKQAWAKYGDCNQWPQEIIQKSMNLGKHAEDKMGNRTLPNTSSPLPPSHQIMGL